VWETIQFGSGTLALASHADGSKSNVIQTQENK
jgi:hypothetical protein